MRRPGCACPCAVILISDEALAKVGGYLLVPRIMGRTVQMPAIVSLISVLISGVLPSIIGALVAIPVAAARASPAASRRSGASEIAPGTAVLAVTMVDDHTVFAALVAGRRLRATSRSPARLYHGT